MTAQIQIVDELNVEQLAQLRHLERRVDSVDGGRLKLEWGSLEGGRVKRAALAYDGTTLVGYLGRYQFADSTAELSGMVDPSVRRQRIGTQLLDGLLAACAAFGDASVLIVVPRSSDSGLKLAKARGSFDHAEHSLILNGEPGPAITNPAIGPASNEVDFDRISELVEEGFGHPARPSNDPSAHTWVVVEDEQIIGTIRLSHEGASGYISGFVIAAARQGQGIGRDILRRACVQLRDDGASTVELEVFVTNERAIGLYTSLGFTPQTTKDYYKLPTG